MSAGFAFVIPDFRKIHQDFFIYPENINGAKTDDKVIVEVIAWAEHDKKPEAKVVEILGKAGAAAGGLLQSGVNGFVVPERDPDALAAALQRILDEPDLRQRMSMNARQIVAQWTNERMVQGFQDAIQYALRTRRVVQPDIAGVHP